MSTGTRSQREVAYRVFAREFDDATYDYSEGDDERAPNYVVTPSGARVNRLFIVGVLTSVEQVNEGIVRARIADPTGVFILYAGQYQPDAVAFLENAEIPSFVAVTGKARVFEPEGSDRILSSVRPESITSVDVETRDRWTVQAAEHTLARIATFTDMLENINETSDAVTWLDDQALNADLTTGIRIAFEEYGTTQSYLSGLQTVGIQALEVIAGEREEVEPMEVDPAETSEVETPVEIDSEEITTSTGLGTTVSVAESAAPSQSESGVPVSTEKGSSVDESRRVPEPPDEPGTDSEEPQSEPSDTDTADDGVTPETPAETTAELDQSDSEEITHITDDSEEITDEQAPSEDGEDDEDTTDGVVDESDLETAVLTAMRDIDDGDGAARDVVISTVAEDHGVDPDDVETAIQDALMGGKCYEPTEGILKAI